MSSARPTFLILFFLIVCAASAVETQEVKKTDSAKPDYSGEAFVVEAWSDHWSLITLLSPEDVRKVD